MTDTYIYILKLKGGNYYVGKTDNVEKRFNEHILGYGSVWTKKYKPISIDKIIKNPSKYDEDRYVKEYMGKYGIDKVRGGTYVRIELDENQKYLLTQEINSANDLCSRCGRGGHFIKDCYAKNNESSDDELTYKKSTGNCYRCGRKGHYSNDCYAKNDVNGNVINDELSDDESSDDELTYKKSTGNCYRCGRKGHYSNDCYASTHIKGYDLD